MWARWTLVSRVLRSSLQGGGRGGLRDGAVAEGGQLGGQSSWRCVKNIGGGGVAVGGNRVNAASITRRMYSSEGSTSPKSGPSKLAQKGKPSLAASGAEPAGGGGGGKIPPQAVSFASLAALMITAGGMVAGYRYLREEQVKGSRNLPSSGKAAVGGPWTLVGPDGKAFASKNLEGEFSLLYFGFTFCPDICPDELEKIAESIDLVEKMTKRKVRPVFITIDPERDDRVKVNEYCEEFHPRLLGLTGSKEQIKKITRLFRVYFTKTNDSDEDYLIDHSIISYLIDPEGNFIKFFGKNSTASDMSMEMKKFIDQWKNTHRNY